MPKARPRQHHQPLVSDYETDPNMSDFPVPAPPRRTNEQLNLSVLQRHNPSITSILSIAPYAVLYIFSPTSEQWEKQGIEGTLFVCQLTPSPIGSERYSVVILNRRGLDNFQADLFVNEDIEVTDDYIILQILDQDTGTPNIFGLWIFSEPEPSSTAHTKEIVSRLIQECAAQAESSRKAIEEQMKPQNGFEKGVDDVLETSEPEPSMSVPMGRQLSLRELFGKQREQDSGWSVQNHHSPIRESVQPMQSMQPPQSTQPPQPMFRSTPDTDFFRSGPRFTPQQEQKSAPSSQAPIPAPQAAGDGDVLGTLFQRAKASYHGQA